MTRFYDSAGYYRRRAAQERGKAERAPNENRRRLHLELADLLTERALIAEQTEPPANEVPTDV